MMIDTTQLLQSARETLAEWVTSYNEPEPGRLDVYLAAEAIVPAVKTVTINPLWHLSGITALDIPQTASEDGHIELLYHFCRNAFILTLRIRVDYGLPLVDSIYPVIPAASLYEREASEMFGVIFEGLPNRDRLLLPDDWPDGVYPLRKSFTGLE